LIEFEPLPTGLYHVVSDRGRGSTLFILMHLLRWRIHEPRKPIRHRL
jgi:hypothetical protein